MNNKYNLKYPLILIVMLFLSMSLSAQYYLVGMVRDSATSVGVPNRSVVISKANSTYTKTVVTDVSGFFYDTLIISGAPQTIYVSTTDCNQITVTDSLTSSIVGLALLDICTYGMPLCMADYGYYSAFSSYKKIIFYNKSSSSADNYIWDFGDGGSSMDKNPYHVYATAGSYIVCLSIVDTNTYCTDNYCDTVFVTASNSCVNSFMANANGLKLNVHGSVNVNYPTDYIWNFGDGTPEKYGKVKSHNYAANGTYQVCLKTLSYNFQTGDTCIAQSCQSLTVSGLPMVGLYGQVFQGLDRSDKGFVYLYKYTQSNQEYKLIDSARIQWDDTLNLSFYYFDEVFVGKYTTKARLNNSSVYIKKYAPAYYGNTIHWNQANQIDLQQAGNNYPINLTEIVSVNGKGAVRGTVLEGTLKSPGDPVAGIPLYLVNEANVILGYVLSDQSGDYSFDDIPYDKYYVYADLINYQIFPSTATPDEGDKEKTGIDIYIGKGIVTGIPENGISQMNLSVFPNPSSHDVTIKMELQQDQLLSAKLYNMMGSEVAQLFTKEYFSAGIQQRRIDLGDLPNGVYSLSIEDSNHNRKLIKLIIVQ